MTLTLAQSLTVVAGSAWLMIQAGVGKKLLRAKAVPRCAACRRRLDKKRCACYPDR